MRGAIRLVTLTVVLLAAFGAVRFRVAVAEGVRLGVTRFDDPAGAGACPADCSLRQAVASVGDGGTVTLPSGRYTLDSGQLLIAQNITIAGAGARTTWIGQTARSRVIEVAAGAVFLSGVTITGGHTVLGGPEPNAGVGGGIWIDTPGSLAVQDAAISGNHADQSGGGIDVNGRLTVERSTVSGNETFGGLGIGGGIDDFGLGVTIVNSTIAGNFSRGDGGGLFSADGVSLTNVTIAGNTSVANSGGILVYGGAGVTAVSTILSDNTGANCGGAMASLGHNLSSDQSCGLSASTDVENAVLRLGALQNNGGPTDTLAPMPGSPAIDAAPIGACPPTDQRGVARPQGSGCDTGAVERLGASSGLLVFSDGCNIVATPPDGSASTVVVDARARLDPVLGNTCFTDPAWSADGRRLAFVGFSPPSSYSLWTLDYPAGEPRMIAAGLAATPGGPSWSPDGGTIAFDSGDLFDGWTIQTVPSNGSASPSTLLAGAKNFRMPAWSPDGRAIAFAWDGPTETGVVGIYTVAGGTMASVPGTAGGEYPRWSPGGGSIAFSAGGFVKVVNLSNGSVVTLSDGSDFDTAPAWSPDGSELAFRVQDSGEDIWTMSASDGSHRTLVTWGAYEDSVVSGHHPVDWQPIVNRLATTTTIVEVAPDPSAVAQPATVTISVAAIAPVAVTPTGSVTVSDGVGSTCTAVLIAGGAQCALSATAAGDQTLVAIYSGDSTFDSSTGRHAHTVTSLNTPPVVATPLSATPNPVSGNTTSLNVLGADDGGEANLTYTWTAVPATVAFSANGTNAAKNAVAAFGAPGSYAITVTITDRGGLTATTAVTVVVLAPVVIAINERVSVTDANGSPIGVAEPIHIVDGAVVSVSGSTAASPLSIAVNEHVSISDSLPQTSELAERVLIVDRATVSVHAIDRRPPVLELPGPVVAEATGPLGAIVSFTATAIDAVDGPRPVICAPASGSLFPLGHTTVLCTSTDRAGNEAHGRVNVRVRDTTPPVLATAPDVTVTTPLRRVPVTFTLPAATDAVDPAPIVTATPPSGSLFPVGSTTVRVRARDESGNVRTETFTVTVIQRPPR